MLSINNCFYYLLLAVLDLRCSLGFSLVAESEGCSPVMVRGLLIAEASLVAEYGLYGWWVSVVAVCGLSSCGTLESCQSRN